MANTPKIRYEIEAAAVGSADVRKLTGELEKLDDALSPQTAAAAARLVEELNSLGRQASAIERFQELKTSSAAAAAALEQAQAAAQQMAAQLAAAGTPTRTQAGQLEKLFQSTPANFTAGDTEGVSVFGAHRAFQSTPANFTAGDELRTDWTASGRLVSIHARQFHSGRPPCAVVDAHPLIVSIHARQFHSGRRDFSSHQQMA